MVSRLNHLPYQHLDGNSCFSVTPAAACDPLGLADNAMSILIHEAKNAYTSPRVPESQDESEKGQVRVKAISCGHSTAKMAGQFSTQTDNRNGLYLQIPGSWSELQMVFQARLILEGERLNQR